MRPSLFFSICFPGGSAASDPFQSEAFGLLGPHMDPDWAPNGSHVAQIDAQIHGPTDGHTCDFLIEQNIPTTKISDAFFQP